jgi:hypothetical protein
MSDDFRTGIKIGFIAVIGAHLVGLLLGLLTVGAMLLVGSILALMS